MSTVSILNPEIDYNNEFENPEISEDDLNKETDLYKIKIFGEYYLIGIGIKNIHEADETLEFYRVYLIFQDKVITKIGIYEKKVDDEEVNFENLDLIINNKYYTTPHELEDFKIRNMNNIENVNNNEEGFMVNDKFKFTYTNSNYPTISTITDNGNVFETYGKTFKKSVQSIVTTLLKKIFKMPSERPNYLSLAYIQYFVNNFILKSSKENGKTIHQIVLKEYLRTKEYKLTIPLLIFFEYLLNIKFIVINNENKIDCINVIGSNPKIMKIDIKEDDTENKKIKDFDPEQIIFIKQSDEEIEDADLDIKLNVYNIVKYNNKDIQNLSEGDLKDDEDMKNLIKGLLSTTYYEYDSNNLLKLKELVNFDENTRILPTTTTKKSTTTTKKKITKKTKKASVVDPPQVNPSSAAEETTSLPRPVNVNAVVPQPVSASDAVAAEETRSVPPPIPSSTTTSTIKKKIIKRKTPKLKP